jgi:hypothetical protein
VGPIAGVDELENPWPAFEARIIHSVAWSLYRLHYSGSPCLLLRRRKSEPIAKKGYVM